MASEDTRHFREHGYVIKRGFLSSEQVRQLTSELKEHTKKLHEVTGERHWVCEVEPEYQKRELVFLAEPGAVCFFSALVIHRSDPNISKADRKCLVAEFDEVGNLAENPGWGSPIPPKHWE